MNGSCGTSTLPNSAAAAITPTIAIPIAKPALPTREVCGRLDGDRRAHPARSLGSSSALRMSASSVRPI